MWWVVSRFKVEPTFSSTAPASAHMTSVRLTFSLIISIELDSQNLHWRLAFSSFLQDWFKIQGWANLQFDSTHLSSNDSSISGQHGGPSISQVLNPRAPPMTFLPSAVGLWIACWIEKSHSYPGVHLQTSGTLQPASRIKHLTIASVRN